MQLRVRRSSPVARPHLAPGEAGDELLEGRGEVGGVGRSPGRRARRRAPRGAPACRLRSASSISASRCSRISRVTASGCSTLARCARRIERPRAARRGCARRSRSACSGGVAGSARRRSTSVGARDRRQVGRAGPCARSTRAARRVALGGLRGEHRPQPRASCSRRAARSPAVSQRLDDRVGDRLAVPASRTVAARSAHIAGGPSWAEVQHQDEPVDPLGRVRAQPHADHAAERQAARRGRARCRGDPAARARRAPMSAISYGPGGTGELAVPAVVVADAAGSARPARRPAVPHASVVPSESRARSTGASVAGR